MFHKVFNNLKIDIYFLVPCHAEPVEALTDVLPHAYTLRQAQDDRPFSFLYILLSLAACYLTN